jgi:hypothetical protein
VDPAVADLRAEVDRLRSQLGALLGEIRQTFAALAARPAGVAAAPRTPPDHGALAGWLAWLHAHYPLQGKLPACWWRHPAVAAELAALHAAWQAGQGAQADPYAALDWHARWLPSTLDRIRDWLPRPCLGTAHTEDPPTRYGRPVDDPAAFEAYLRGVPSVQRGG